MAKERTGNGGGSSAESVISIIGPGMKVVGDCETAGTVRVEGTVEGSIVAGKAVVVGKAGRVVGDIVTKDAVISGTVEGSVAAESRLEVQATSRIDGQIQSRRMQLEEGAVFNGTVKMGEVQKSTPMEDQGGGDAAGQPGKQPAAQAAGQSGGRMAEQSGGKSGGRHKGRRHR